MSLKTYAYFGAAIALVVGVLWYGEKRETEGEQKVQAVWDRAEVIAGIARGVRIGKVQVAREGLQQEMDDERTKRAKAEDVLAAERKRFTDELQQRPTRADLAAGLRPDVSCQLAGTGSSHSGGYRDGRDLPREDAIFLEGDADLARRIAAQRDTCYRRYEAADKRLRELAAPR